MRGSLGVLTGTFIDEIRFISNANYKPYRK